MRNLSAIVLASCLFFLLSAGLARAENWPAWRGPDGTGVTSETDLPIRWSSTQNIRWKVPLDEPGNSTPIIWGDRIFLTQQRTLDASQPVSTDAPDASSATAASRDAPTAKSDRKPNENADSENKEPSGADTQTTKPPIERTVMCFDRADGKLLWQRGVSYAKKDQTHPENPYCSPSPVTDGQRVIAWHGSAGLVCYDFDGKQLWFRDLGPQEHPWGYGSSPVLHGDLCFLNFGPGPRSFIIAVNKHTGETVWDAQIPEPAPGEDTGPIGGDSISDELRERVKDLRGSFCTPLVIDADGREELIVGMPNRVRSFDPATGKALWTCGGLGRLVYSSASWGDGVLVTFGGWHSASIAVRPGGSGDVDETHLVWRHKLSKSRLGSGVVKDGRLYITDTSSIAECIDIQTGESLWRKRLSAPGSGRGATWSSVMLSGDRCYAVNQSGDAFVFRAAPKFESIATNSLGETTNSSLAPSDGEIFFRTHKHLWCIAEERSE